MKQNATKSAVKKTTARKKVSEAQNQIDTQSQISNPEDYNAKVANKAYELFERRGFQHGYHIEDWFQAERIIKEGLNS
jgi:hypothetical protein